MMTTIGVIGRGMQHANDPVDPGTMASALEIGRLVLVLPHSSSAVEISADDRALAVTLVDQLGAVLAANAT